MKKSNLIIGIVSIFIILASLALMLYDIFVPIYFWFHPILNFFSFALIGFGVLSCTLGIIKKSSFYFFLAICLLSPAIFYILIQYIKWWIVLIIILSLCAIFIVVGIMLFGNKTEDIALNESPEYKDYKQRRAEKLADEENKQEELPELKSFKD